MKYMVRPALEGDLPRIEEIYAGARAFMAASGNPTQWGTSHPPLSLLERDIAQGNLYVLANGETIHGVFAFLLGEDPTYGVIYDGAWHSEEPYGTIHRVAGDGSGGILAAAVEFAAGHSRYLRIDTHGDNAVMQRAIEKQGFRPCGRILTDDGTPRIAYDRISKGREIRQAREADISRIAEILVFTKRMNYRQIFHDDGFSFGQLQVLSVAKEYFDHPELLSQIWVYDDGIVKGMIHIAGREVKQLYVDHFFEGQGIGSRLLSFALETGKVNHLWVLEKNSRAAAFYRRHGFRDSGVWCFEEGTPERVLLMVRQDAA